MTKVCRFPHRTWVLLVSVLALLHPSQQHEVGSLPISSITDNNVQWAEPHNALWKQRVTELKHFLTPEGRQELQKDLADRTRELTKQNDSHDASEWKGLRSRGRIRGKDPNEKQRAQSTVDDRDLQIVDSNNDLNVLVVLMQWSNHPDRNQAVSPEDYRKLFNGSGRDETLFPGGSVKEYFETMSYGQFKVNFEVTDWIMTDFTEQQFTADGSQGRTQELQQAFEPVLQWLDDDFFKFREFDNNYDRRIDMTIFLHSGYDGSEGGNDCETGATAQQRVASHARTGADMSEWLSRTGHRLGAYAVAPAFRGTCNLEIGRIGTIVHEMIHPFGIPDLYDMEGAYGTGNIGGIDRFGVMANPSGNSGGDLSWPGHVSAWTRQELGWINPTVIDSNGIYELKPVETHAEMFKITQGFENKEYLLLENRQAIDGDFDEKFFSSGGILIYHVDENIWDVFDNGGNEGNFPRGGPFQSQWPGNGKHYPVALVQADGLYELEQGINGGDEGDIWNDPQYVLGPGNGEKVASKATYPNTDSYASGNIQPTGITIKNFQTNNEGIVTFEVCFGACTSGNQSTNQNQNKNNSNNNNQNQNQNSNNQNQNQNINENDSNQNQNNNQDVGNNTKKSSKVGLGVGIFLALLLAALSVLGWIYREKVRGYLSKCGNAGIRGYGEKLRDSIRNSRRLDNPWPSDANPKPEEQSQAAKIEKSQTNKESKAKGDKTNERTKSKEKPKVIKTEKLKDTSIKTTKSEEKAAKAKTIDDKPSKTKSSERVPKAKKSDEKSTKTKTPDVKAAKAKKSGGKSNGKAAKTKKPEDRAAKVKKSADKAQKSDGKATTAKKSKDGSKETKIKKLKSKDKK